MLPKPTHDYIATAKCGCIVGLIADIQGTEKETAKEVANFIKQGCKVERVNRDSEQFKTAIANFGHHCEPKQMKLFAIRGTNQ
jgi:hypothetical protein